MGESSLPDTLLTRLDEIERQQRDLNQSAQTQYSSIREGALTILDGDGNAIIRLGKLSDTAYGIVVVSGENRQVFAAGPGISTAPPGIVPMVVSTSAIVGGTSFRPGTNSASLTEIWKGEFFSVGPDVFWTVTIFPNAGNMDFRVTIQEEGGGPEQTVWNETGTTANSVRSATFAIPTSCLVPATGTDVLGRFFLIRMLAKKNSGPASVDIAIQRHPLNASFI